MTKIALPLAIIAIAASIFTFFSVQPSSELVYVDINKLIDGYKRTAVEKTKFEEKATQMQANVDSLLQNWQEELKVYEKERPSMTEKELELKRELLSNKQQQIGNYQQAIQKQIQEEDQKATQTVMNDINDYIQEFGKKNSYKIIFGASGSGNIMYADPASDLTEKVLEGLNADFNSN
tara:strand:+ start:719478 stop:720011 length:534 start_codon:yes stop_codon:yes gene_type:complete